MTKRLLLAVVAGIIGLDLIVAGQATPKKRPAPTHIQADRHDVSPPLRTIPPGRFAIDGEPEGREPHSQRHAVLKKRPFTDTVVQGYPTSLLTPLSAQSFEGTPNLNGVLPPDTNGDVGPNHFVQWVNLSLAIYTKGAAGAPPTLTYGPVNGSTLWTGFGGPCETMNNGDPIVLYDSLADRWFMSQLAIPNRIYGILLAPFYQCIAVSTTSDPAGAYYRYQFSFNRLNDYPKFGVWPDAYYMTMNQFAPITLAKAGQGVVAFDREKMLSGLPASMIYFDLSSVDPNLGGMLPATMTGPAPPAGSPGYFVEMDDDAWGFSPDQLQLWRFHADFANPSSSSFTGPSLMPTAPFDSNLCGYARNCLPQPGTTAKVDALADRLMYRLQYRNLGDHEALVVNQTVDVDGTDHAGIRWYEVRDPATTPFIYQQGTYSPDGDNRWMGSAAMDRAGNIALGFSVASATTAPSIRVTGRFATDPLGVMTLGETSLVDGSGGQTHATGRWGDYSSMSVDPADGCTFWYTQEYYSSVSLAGWQTRIGTFALPSCSSGQHLPTVTISAPLPNAQEAGLVGGAFSVTRSGDTSAPLVVQYTVDGTATAGADYVALPGTITIPAGAASATIPVTPFDDTLVEGDETVVATLSANSAYFIGAPAGAIVRIVDDDLPSDLVVTAVSAPALGGVNIPFTITETTANVGGGPALASSTAFFLSTNTTLDAKDIPLASRAVPALAPGASSSASTDVTIPSGTAPGSYYIIASADATNVNPEPNETNNVKASAAIRIGVDLVLTQLTVPQTAGAGSSVSVSDTTANQGGQDAVGSTTSFYLSMNALLEPTDPLIGSRTVLPLAAGASSTATTTVAIPPDTATGLYYVIAKADANGAIAETSEINNTRFSSQIKIGPDLVTSFVLPPSVAGAGAPLTVTDTTKNQGAGSAAASVTSFYLSTNTFLEAGDIPLGSRPVAPLPAGGSDTATTTLVIPSGTANGNYYLLAQADGNNAVVESIEANNTAFALIRIGPDLTVTAFTVPATLTAGVPASVSDTTKNAGGGAAAASVTQYYLSTDLTFSASDVLIGSRSVAALAGNASDSGTGTLTIPATTAPGTYYIYAVADGTATVLETSETNNTRLAIVRVVAP